MTGTPGERFVTALAAKDVDGLRAVLAPTVDVRALTPGAFWEASTADDFVERVALGQWFEPTDDITGVVHVDRGDDVGARHRVGYRLTVTNDDGDFVVEQQAYYEDDGDRITWLRILCAGYQPVG
jgi:hypothetical protein